MALSIVGILAGADLYRGRADHLESERAVLGVDYPARDDAGWR